VWSWGAGGSGSLGDGSYGNSDVPVRVKGLRDIKAITAGGGTAFAVGADGALWSWGYGLFGQLGEGLERDSNVPVRVRSIGTVSAISMGDSEVLALLRNGTVWWWGVQVDTGATRDTPRKERGLRGIVGVSQGGEAAYAWSAMGPVWAWGDGEMGELGNGTYRDSATPVEITRIRAVAVSGGQGWALGLGPNGVVWMWGASPVAHETARPVEVQGLQRVIAVAAGGDDAFAIVETAGSFVGTKMTYEGVAPSDARTGDRCQDRRVPC
jgi:alpha-tubulin suppressor-like RCC1 family protein